MKKVIRYIWGLLFIALLAFFVIMAAKGSDIHDKACPKVKTSRVKTIAFDGVRYLCINKECVRDGKVYKVYSEKGFFNDNIRVKAIEVDTMESPREDMLIILSGIESDNRAYYALIPIEGLIDGEAIVIESNNKTS